MADAVFSNTGYPYNTVCYILDTISGNGYRGSGVLISPDEILTATHVIYASDKGSATNINVSPGYNSNSAPYGTFIGDLIHYNQIADPNGSIAAFDTSYDYAVIHLSHPVDIGYMGIQSNWGGGAVHITGFPASYGTQMIDYTMTVSVGEYGNFIGTATGGGSSGGPVWIMQNGLPYVVGVVSSENQTTNTGNFSAIHLDDFNRIQSWVSADDANERFGTSGNDHIIVSNGNLDFWGFVGRDTVSVNYTHSQESFSGSGENWTMVGPQGTDRLDSIERVQFTDVIRAFDISGDAGQAYRMYRAAFDRAPDQNGVSYWTNALDHGLSLHNLGVGFVDSAEFRALYGTNPSSQTLITKFYQNVLDRNPDTAGLNYWVGKLQGGMAVPDMLTAFSESTENMNQVMPLIGNGIYLTSAYMV